MLLHGLRRIRNPGSPRCAERILGLCSTVFRVDCVLLLLRDGRRQLRKGGEAAISAGALSQAACALQAPDQGITVVEDPAADSRRAPSPRADRSKMQANTAMHAFAVMPGSLQALLHNCVTGHPAEGDLTAGAHACRLAGAEDARREVKFFAAAPLVAGNGYRLGSLCARLLLTCACLCLPRLPRKEAAECMPGPD